MANIPVEGTVLNEKPSRKQLYLADPTKAPIGPSTPRLFGLHEVLRELSFLPEEGDRL